jgi:myo-inositol-1(or 4)-monophosphatase
VTRSQIRSGEGAELEELAVELAREAGRLIVEERPDRVTVAETKSSATDVVTVMDQRAERLLRDRLAAARPDDGILGEEGESTSGSSGLTWVVDPIDGTVNYLYGLAAFAVSVAVVTGDPTTPGAWEPVAAAVDHPVAGETFHARAGGGSFVSSAAGSPVGLRANHVDRLDRALIGTGFGYRAEDRRRQGAVVADLLPHVRDIRRAGSAALDLCHVAAGRLDGYYESGLNPWDLAGGQLVLTEAGGRVSGLHGAPPSRDMVIAAGPALHPLLREAVDTRH